MRHRAQRFLVVCSVHQDSKALAGAKTLGRTIEETYRRHFGRRTSVTSVWIEIPRGQAFIAGRPSRTSTVLAPVPNSTPQPEREAFMRDMCNIFQEGTGCNVNEIVVSAVDVERSKEYAKASRARFDPKRVRGLAFRVLARMLFARPRKGALSTNLNMPG